MANIATAVTTSVSNLFTAPAGSDFVLNVVARSLGATSAISISSVMSGNTGPELVEHSLAVRYPTVNIYCDKVSNSLQEKFRTFSGTVRVAVELRHTQEQIQNIQAGLECYVAAVCQVLDESRGDWGGGLFYTGGYEISFNPVKRGGRNFLQTARVTLDVAVSV